MTPEHCAHDAQPNTPDDVPEPTATTTVSRRGWGKHMLLGASALAVLWSTKPADVHAAPPTDTWKLGGNADVDATNFIGPTNSAPLIIKTGGVERMRVTASGNVGIGNASPTAKLLVDVAKGVAVYARRTDTTGDAPAVRGDTNSTVDNASGVLGQVVSTSPGRFSAGVWGDNKSTTGLGVGVRGTQAAGGYGVYGQAGTNGTGVYATAGNIGVYSSGGSYGLMTQATGAGSYGVHASGRGTGVSGFGGTYGIYGAGQTGVYGTSSTGAGMVGKSTASSGVYGETSASNHAGVAGSGGKHGVLGINGSEAGVRGNSGLVGVWGEGATYGLFGKATAASGVTYGVFGSADSSRGSAGYFQGNVIVTSNLNVTGNVSKGGGSFKIDHPLDPENKYLYHSFVESPDMMNVYNGNVVTDANGNATVTLPAYFEALNRDFRYQLTPVGQLAQAAVIDEITGNRFTVKTDKPNVKLSWQVTGIRQDTYANANRIVVEVAKPSKERGRYLHPEAFGKPVSMSTVEGLAPQSSGIAAPPQQHAEPVDPHPIAPDAPHQ